MSIAQLVSARHWFKKLDRSRWLSLEPLKPLRFGTGFAGYDDHASVEKNFRDKFGTLPDVVTGYKPSEHLGFDRLPCKTVLQYNETKEPRFVPEIKANRPTGVIFHHYNDFIQWRDWLAKLGIKSCHIPHVADPEIFYPRNVNKRIDCLLVGSMSQKIYPLREKFKQALELLCERGFRCEILKHPGNEFERADTCDHLRYFADSISQARIVCYCSSVFKYRLQKYVEVPACGVVSACDVPIVEDGEGIGGAILFKCSDMSSRIIAECLEDDIDDERLAPHAINYASKYTPDFYTRRFTEFVETL